MCLITATGDSYDSTSYIPEIYAFYSFVWSVSKSANQQNFHDGHVFVCIDMINSQDIMAHKTLNKSRTLISAVWCCHRTLTTNHPFRRGIAPPQRIKSVSMATFTAAEVQLVEQRGNEVWKLFCFFIFPWNCSLCQCYENGVCVWFRQHTLSLCHKSVLLI